MIIKVFKDYTTLSLEASQEVIALVHSKKDCHLGLATGSTPLTLYDALISDYALNATSYKEVKVFNLDEYVGLPSTHPMSYYNFMKHHLFNHIDIQLSNCFIPSGTKDNLNDECLRYNTLLHTHQIDLQLLGIGANGHIGFNEPGTPFDQETHVITLEEKTRKDNARFFDSLEDVPKEAITMGIKNILSAKHIVLLASGKNKAKAIYRLVYESMTEDLPASALKHHPSVTLYLDKEAASLLYAKEGGNHETLTAMDHFNPFITFRL